MSVNQRILSGHIARETQLLAEEKWIIDALNKIKAQRNSLQIERLNLESIKSQLKNDKRQTDSQYNESTQEENVSAVNLMQLAAGTALSSAWDKEDANCNVEELNLTVTNPVLTMCAQELDSMSAEEEEEDEEDEEDDDEVMLDINMLMDAANKAD